MDSGIRVVLDAAGRVVGFSHEHPDGNPISQPLVESLVALTTKADGMLEQFLGGQLAASLSVKARKRVEADIRENFNHVRRIADTAALRDPAQAIAFRVPKERLSHKAFVAASRRGVATAIEHREMLQTYGMPDTLPETITTQIDEVITHVGQKTLAHQAHVGARAELPKLVREILLIIRHLNALNLIRFADNAELLAAWKSASEIQGPPRLPKKRGAKKGELPKAA